MTNPPSTTHPPAPTIVVEEGCCAGNSPMTWSYCKNIDSGYACEVAAECTWIEGDEDAEECNPPTVDPTPWTTPAPQYSTEGCCAGTEYDPRSWTFCANYDNGDDCEGAGVCTWNEGADTNCELPTEPPITTMPPAPTHVGTGCCYGNDPFNALCFSVTEERSCDSAINCDWIPTEDVDECLHTEPPTTSTPPAPTHSTEECCSGYCG